MAQRNDGSGTAHRPLCLHHANRHYGPRDFGCFDEVVTGVLEALPYRLRKRLADNGPARAFLGLRVAALK